MCVGLPLGIVFCVNFLKTFKSFCQQGQRQIDPGDEVAERWPEEGWAKQWAELFLRPSLDFQTLVSGGRIRIWEGLEAWAWACGTWG